MKLLFQLAQINTSSYDLVELLAHKEKDDALNKLINIIFSGKEISNSHAMISVFGANRLSSFSRLKAKLIEILIKVTLLQNTQYEAKHSRINESLNQYRNSVASLFLLQRRANSLSIEIAEMAIAKSIKYHATESVIMLTRILKNHYGSVEYNRKKYSHYDSIQRKYLEIQHWEVKAESYYFEIQNIKFLSAVSDPNFIIKKIKLYIQELESAKEIKTYIFIITKYKVKATYFEFNKDYNSLLSLCESTIKELSHPDYSAKKTLANINIRKAWALIQAGRNDEAILLTSKDMKILPSGSFGWYFIAHYKLKALLYKVDYGNAVKLIKLMIEDPGFSKLGGNHKELFGATLGYIHLIVNAGLAGDPVKMVKVLPDFKIGKFLNTIPVFSKDKQGINVSILLMHIGFLLQRKNYNAIIDRIDSLKQYAYKYLRKDDTFRSNCMIKMVVQMTKADFNPIRTERYTSDLYKQLEQVKLAGSGETIETEIIPYEVLWSIMKKAIQ